MGCDEIGHDGDVSFGYTLGLEALGRPAGGGGLDGEGFAGVDGEDGFGAEVVEAPGYGCWRGEEGLGAFLGLRAEVATKRRAMVGRMVLYITVILSAYLPPRTLRVKV